MSDCFRISVKGVLEVSGKYLLRHNERNEWELLGGTLEADDASIEGRLIQEFLEESGIKVTVSGAREPWLYEIGSRCILILPYVCAALHVPATLFDQDGGTLGWFADEQLDGLNMPAGYLCSIRGLVPVSSQSPAVERGSDQIGGRPVRIQAFSCHHRAGQRHLRHHEGPRQTAQQLLRMASAPSDDLAVHTELAASGEVVITFTAAGA
jgi:hypothetical protein